MSLSRSSLSPTVGSFSVAYLQYFGSISLCLSATSLHCKTSRYCIELSKQEYHLLGSESNLSDLLSTAKSSGSVCGSVLHVQKKCGPRRKKVYSKATEMKREIGNTWKHWVVFMREDMQWSYIRNGLRNWWGLSAIQDKKKHQWANQKALRIGVDVKNLESEQIIAVFLLWVFMHL